MNTVTKEIILQAIEQTDIALISTHKRLSIPIINRISKKMINGIKFDAIKVCENLIIDGHHRFISSILANIKLDQVKFSKTSATIKYDWLEVDFVDEEWDTAHKIDRLNELDAKFNNIPLKQIIELTK